MSELIQVLPQRRISRDEMNLAEFPLTMLSTRGDPKVKTLEFKDLVRGKNGESVNRHWIITGADKFGLPTASDDEVLLGLLKLTVDEGVRARKVYFTRYELLRALRWTTEGRSYSRLQKALDRLSGVRIKATNAFYDNETKAHSTRNFGIIDGYEINDAREPDSKSSFFTWSEVLFKSFQAGFIKKLDLEFYLDLESAVSKRLYRYLDKHFWYKSKIQINLFTLAHEKIGVSRNYRYASSLRQQLDPAIEELIKLQFLARAEYTGRGSATEVILYAGKPSSLPKPASASPAEADSDSRETRKVFEGEVQEERGDTLLRSLITRGIQAEQAERLLDKQPEAARKKIARIIDHFDFLRETSSPRISRSPAGFLFHAVKNWETFILPGEKRGGSQGNLSFEKSVHARRADVERVEQKRKEERESIESRYLVARKQEIRRLRDNVETQMLQKITQEVETAIARLRGQISDVRFQEAIQHGVDERIAKLFSIPDFDEWCRAEAETLKKA